MIAHNAVAFFHDGISVCTHGVPEPEQELKAVAIDIYNNDIHVTGDDFIEADGGVHNIRVMRNRGVNAAHTGLSAQPIFGGPAYYIRNVVYNTPVALKFINPAGVIVYHNTIIAENRTAQRVSNAHFAEQPVPGNGCAGRHLGARRTHGVFDATTTTGTVPTAARSSNTRGSARSRACGSTTRARPNQAQRFKTLAELAAATGQETHGIEVDYDIFESLRPPAPPDSSKPGTPVPRRGSELPAEAREQSGGRGGPAAERERRVRRQGAGPRRVRSRTAAPDLRTAVAEGQAVLPVIRKE